MLKTVWDESQPVCGIVQKKSEGRIVFFLGSYKGENPLMPEGGYLHYGTARGTFAFQLLLSRELLKNGLGKILGC